MSSYFKAAEACGLRVNAEEAKRCAQRTVASSTPSALLDETRQNADKLCDAVVAATGARRPPSELVILREAELPLAADRSEHRQALEASEEDIRHREEKMQLEFEQRQKVERLEREELERALAEEAKAAAATELARQEREAAACDAQERTRSQLRDMYGPCFLWNKEATEKVHRKICKEIIEKDVDHALRQAFWIDEGLQCLADGSVA